jgi:hypothetical protein
MAKKKLRPTVSHLASSQFSRRGLRSNFEYRDLGVGRATGGRAHAHVIRQYEGQKPTVMKAGSCFLQPPRIRHREVAHSKNLEMIKVIAPQRFRTYDAKGR